MSNNLFLSSLHCSLPIFIEQKKPDLESVFAFMKSQIEFPYLSPFEREMITEIYQKYA